MNTLKMVSTFLHFSSPPAKRMNFFGFHDFLARRPLPFPFGKISFVSLCMLFDTLRSFVGLYVHGHAHLKQYARETKLIFPKGKRRGLLARKSWNAKKFILLAGGDEKSSKSNIFKEFMFHCFYCL